MRNTFTLKNVKRNEDPTKANVQRIKKFLQQAIRANSSTKYTVTKTNLMKALEELETLEGRFSRISHVDLVETLAKVGEERGIKISKVSDDAIFFANLEPGDNKEGGLGLTQREIAALVGTTKGTIGKRAGMYRDKHPEVFKEDEIEKILTGEPKEAFRAMVVGFQQDINATTSIDTKFKLRNKIMELSKDKILEDLESKDRIADLLHRKFTMEIPIEINREVRKFFTEQGITAEFDVREQILKVLEADEELLALAKNKQ